MSFVVKRPRVVLLDLDGTLLDTLGDITLALGRALARHQRPEIPEPIVATMVGDGARTLVARALAAPPASAAVDAVLADFLAAYGDAPTSRTRLMPGALELLDALGARSIPAIVCTNKPGPLARIIVARVLGSLIFATLGGGDTERLKPDPQPIHAALSLASVPARDAWMVGDGAQDIAAARAAGVFAIGVRSGYGDVAAADLVIDTLRDLIRWL